MSRGGPLKVGGSSCGGETSGVIGAASLRLLEPMEGLCCLSVPDADGVNGGE